MSSKNFSLGTDCLGSLLNQHQITLKNLSDLEQDMGKLLDKKDTLRYENCEDLVIKIGSKINRIIFVRCKNIQVELNGLISGLEIKHSNSIEVINKIKKPVNSVQVEHSNDITVKISKQAHKQTVYEIDRTTSINIKDHNDKQLRLK